MNLRGEKYVRFDDCSSEKSFSLDRHWIRGMFRLRKPSLNSIVDGIREGFDRASEMIKGLRKWLSSRKPPPPKINRPRSNTKKRILDPQGPFLQRWNKIFVLSCIIAVALDPLFFYIPVIDGSRFCLSLHKNVEIAACVLRSFVDVFYIFHILLQFRTGFIAPSSRVFGRGELVEDSKAIAKRYLCFYFIIDILSILPLPQ
ncbi:cyclic nucleotide gated channel 1, partial [Perilla frutescens var. hirtella]